MDRRTTGIIATIAAVLLCGCPGLLFVLAGGISALVSQVPGADIDIAGRNDPGTALSFGIGTFCLGILLIAIPIVVGVLMLRNRPSAPAPGVNVYTPPPSASVYTPPSPPPAAPVYTPPGPPPEEPPTIVPPAERPPYTPPPDELTPPDETIPPTS